ncbi:hypothetical protein BDN70DRAFT_992902 [Pholiota conissans]|uniref:DUF8205 domain-containing protein n=1 Tax=Pholiota conissans TaxID=109636 RepID=A0A9P5Z3J8_9AGAR|nr:hypothetical protein BDN70DRAFT_992902 [Pholiota conissans]
MSALSSDANLMGYLHVAIILCLDLIKSPLPANEPFSIVVHLSVEPENIVDFARLRGDLDPPNNASEQIKGMLQISDIYHNPQIEENLGGKEGLRALTSSLKADPVLAPFTSGDSPVGVILFALGKSNSMRKGPIVIEPSYMAVSRKRDPFRQTVAATGKSRMQALGVQSCVEYINTAIRMDKANCFRLRTDMTSEDEEIIRNSAMDMCIYEDKSLALEALRGRLCNEFIYMVLLEFEDIPF